MPSEFTCICCKQTDQQVNKVSHLSIWPELSYYKDWPPPSNPHHLSATIVDVNSWQLYHGNLTSSPLGSSPVLPLPAMSRLRSGGKSGNEATSAWHSCDDYHFSGQPSGVHQQLQSFTGNKYHSNACSVQESIGVLKGPTTSVRM